MQELLKKKQPLFQLLFGSRTILLTANQLAAKCSNMLNFAAEYPLLRARWRARLRIIRRMASRKFLAPTPLRLLPQAPVNPYV